MVHLLHGALVIFFALCCLFFFAFVPFYGQEIVRCDAEFAWAYTPCLLWAWAFALPIMIAFVPAWKIVSTIAEKHGSFRAENARRFRLLSVLCAADGVIFPAGMLVLAFMGAGSAPLTIVITPLVMLICFALALVFYVLHRLVAEAAQLREENELTI